jgi:hypothetical protein
MIAALLKNWSFFRLLRLLVGIMIVIQAIEIRDVILVLLGGVFCFMPLFNIGCCSVNTCFVSKVKSTNDKTDIDYEEVA